MADSVQILHSDSVVKRIHGNNSQQQILASSSGARGRGNKGAYPAMKPSSSIPSKYHTVVIDTADRKGFSSTAKRFNYDLSSHVTPAPNYYSTAAAAATSAVSDSPSYGKRGTGGFASRSVRRSDGAGSAGPGPAGYSIAVSAVVSRSDFNRAAATSSFHPPIAVPRPEGGAGSSAPAPNRYHALEALAKLKENRSRDLGSVFKSTTLRSGASSLADAARLPGPGTYDITRADALVGEGPRVPVSCFRPSGPRQSGPRPTDYPGPGAYEHEAKQQSGEGRGGFQFPMQHYLCLSAPALPLPPTPPLPGPGQYELAPRPVSKHYMSSSMFLSNTSRWGGGGAGGKAGGAGGLPGPAHYQPELPGKQAFSYNADGHWAV